MDVNYSSICCGCLCTGREMRVIDEYLKKQCFVYIISEISMFQPESKSISLCWECEAQLKTFIKFKHKVKQSYTTLSEHMKQNINREYIKSKPKLTSHNLINISLLNITDNIENLFEVITPETYIANYDDNFIDSNSENEELIKHGTKKKILKEKVKKNNKKKIEIYYKEELGEDSNLNEELIPINNCQKCNINFENNDELINHLCAKLEKKNDKRKTLNGKTKRRRKNNKKELYREVELSREELEEERRLAKLKEDYVNAMFKCDRCIICFANAEDLKDHNTMKHDLNSSKFKCAICECSFASEVSFNYHTNKHIKRYQCGVCAERSGSKRSVMKHYEDAHCRGTGLEYDILVLNTQQDNRQDDDEPGDAVKVDESLKQPQSTFPCESCDKTFRWKTSLRKHLETHRIETGQKRKPYCEPCRLSFTTTSNLQKHVKTSSKHQIQLKLRKLKESQVEESSSPEKQRASIEQIKCSVNTAKQVFPCPQCGKRFQWRGNMLRHVQSHAARAKGELVCEPCNRTFSSIATYKQHMEISKKHVSENDFKYMCSDCGKRFANKARLKDHINWEHLKNYVHTCPVCQKIFKSHTSLYLHQQVVHKKDNAEHLCHHCGKAFPNHAKLRAHMRAAHSGGAAYKCAECGAKFSWHSCLSRHQRRAHKQTPA